MQELGSQGAEFSIPKNHLIQPDHQNIQWWTEGAINGAMGIHIPYYHLVMTNKAMEIPKLNGGFTRKIIYKWAIYTMAMLVYGHRVNQPYLGATARVSQPHLRSGRSRHAASHHRFGKSQWPGAEQNAGLRWRRMEISSARKWGFEGDRRYRLWDISSWNLMVDIDVSWFDAIWCDLAQFVT